MSRLRMALHGGAVLVTTLMGACDAQVTGAAAAGPAPRKTYNLTVQGYNYTDYEISSFEVNGQGGGNLMVSSPTDGGGKGVCCVSLTTPVKLPKTVRIKWAVPPEDKRWCELDVALQGPIPPKPEYFEVHFYPDGRIEVAVTEGMSPPRLKLEAVDYGRRHAQGNQPAKINNSAACKDGY